MIYILAEFDLLLITSSQEMKVRKDEIFVVSSLTAEKFFVRAKNKSCLEDYEVNLYGKNNLDFFYIFGN